MMTQKFVINYNTNDNLKNTDDNPLENNDVNIE